MPAFERMRERYLNDEAYSRLQELLLLEPELGDLIQGTGGLQEGRLRVQLSIELKRRTFN